MKKTKILITGLKPNTDYQFQVTATNDLLRSMATTRGLMTQESKAKIGATGGMAGSAFSLLLVGGAVEKMGDGKLSAGKKLALSVVTLPISLMCAPVTVPVGVVWGARYMMKDYCYSGDLSPECDDEKP